MSNYYYKEDDYILEKDIYNPKTLTNIQKRDYNTLLDDMLEYVVDTGADDEKRHPFLNFVRMIETGDAIGEDGLAEHLYGQNIDSYEDDSTASGVYQFNEKSLDSAIRRARNIGVSEEFLRTLPEDPNEWNDVQADVMFLVNLFPRSVPRGQNTYYKKSGRPGLINDLLEDALVDYDREAMEDLYYTLHYTTRFKKYPKTRGVDTDTISRVNKASVPENEINWDWIYYNE
mgnify:CR=1 FL=1